VAYLDALFQILASSEASHKEKSMNWLFHPSELLLNQSKDLWRDV